MEMKFNMNKRLVVLVLDEINEKNLPINCIVGKTSKKSSAYMTDVTFSFDDEVKSVFNDMLCRCINEKLLI